jgi:hypothetical protein
MAHFLNFKNWGSLKTRRKGETCNTRIAVVLLCPSVQCTNEDNLNKPCRPRMCHVGRFRFCVLKLLFLREGFSLFYAVVSSFI